jgi:hypothetical protein
MRARIAVLSASLLLLGPLGPGCQGPRELSPEPSPVGSEPVPRPFSSERAWQHLEALTAIGPRPAGSEGARQARAYLRDALGALDLEVHEQRLTRTPPGGGLPVEIVNLVAVIPGSLPGLFVLAAPYDTRRFESFRFVGANDGGSGAALLLELAQVFAVSPLPYTTWIVFLDGEALPRGPSDPGRGYHGSRMLARLLVEQEAIPAVRLLVVYNRVGDADLRIARDLLSHRAYREEFWRVAARLKLGASFPSTAPYDSLVASHLPLAEAGLRNVVAIADSSFGGGAPPGAYADSEDDDLAHCAPESLDSVGRVSIEALDTLARRLVKIDRFVGSPVEGAVGPSPSPAGAWAEAVAGAAGAVPSAGDTGGDVEDAVVGDAWEEAAADAKPDASNAQEGAPEPRNPDPESPAEAEPGLSAPVP